VGKIEVIFGEDSLFIGEIEVSIEDNNNRVNK